MEVYVKHFREKNYFTVMLQPESTIRDLKNALSEKYDVPTSSIKLIFKSQLLQDENQLVISVEFDEKTPITCYLQQQHKDSKTKEEPSKEPEKAVSTNSGETNQPIKAVPSTPQPIIEEPIGEQLPKFEEYFISMGFNPSDVKKALQLCHNNFAYAQELLISGDISENGLDKISAEEPQTEVYGYVVTHSQTKEEKERLAEVLDSVKKFYESLSPEDKENVRMISESEGVSMDDATYAFFICNNEVDKTREYIQTALRNMEKKQKNYMQAIQQHFQHYYVQYQ